MLLVEGAGPAAPPPLSPLSPSTPSSDDGDDDDAAVREWAVLSQRAAEWNADREARGRFGSLELGTGPTMVDFLFSSLPRAESESIVAAIRPKISAGPFSALPGPAGMLQTAVEAFFRRGYEFPCIHQPTFEAALKGDAGKRTSVYRTPPLALLYALGAASGRALPNYSLPLRIAFTRACLERSRDLLLAKGADDLESAQALQYVLVALFLAGTPGRMFPLLRRCAATAQALVDALPPGLPPTPDDWVFKEMVLRLRLNICGMEVASAAHGGSPILGNYFHPHEAELPCPEAYFIHEHPKEAHEMLIKRGYVPLRARYGGRTWQDAAQTCATLIRAPFEGGSSLAVWGAFNYIRYLKLRPPEATAAPASASAAVAAGLCAVYEAGLRSLPPHPFAVFSRGDASPLLLSWPDHFPHPSLARGMVQLAACLEEELATALSAAGFRNAAAVRALRSASLLAALRDPGAAKGPAVSHLVAGPAFRAGMLLVRHAACPEPGDPVVKAVGKRGLERAVGAVAGVLADVAAWYGLQAGGLAREFARAAAAQGVEVRRQGEVEEDAEGLAIPDEHGGGGRAVYFPDLLFAAERSDRMPRGRGWNEPRQPEGGLGPDGTVPAAAEGRSSSW
ncbi:hypothetical protein DFJ74DRAFT_775721 [Hyaloraphidium curvatum]|nr:hypothetical protein DFJ74DRAFT_775721 [Hyaloraphidium curvatum]